MRQRHLNLIFGIGFIIMLCVSLWPDETPTQIPTIDYSKYEAKFNSLQDSINQLRLQVNTFEQKTDTIKLQILRDETTIKNLDNNGIDSAFAELLRTTR